MPLPAARQLSGVGHAGALLGRGLDAAGWRSRQAATVKVRAGRRQAHLRVVIVGAGVVGCATAVELASRGVEVTVLERQQVAAGASRAAAGMLAPLSESDSEGPLVEAGMESLRLHRTWTPRIERLSGMTTGWRTNGTLMPASGPEQMEELTRRHEWQRRWDASAALLDARRLRHLAPGLVSGYVGALHYPTEAQVEASAYTAALARAAQVLGARIVEGEPAWALEVVGSRVTGVRTASGTVQADATVIATGYESELLAQLGVHLPLGPVKGELVRLQPARPLLKQNLFLTGGYLTPKSDGCLLVGATQYPGRRDLWVEAGSVTKLLTMALAALPELAQARLVDARAGLRPALPDRLPAMGPVPGFESLWMAGGHHRNGVLLAPWSASRLASAIEGDRDAIPDALLPDRHLSQGALGGDA